MSYPSPTRAARAVVAAAAIVLSAACGSDSGEPRPSATWSAVLESPFGDEGAAVLELEGDVVAARAPQGTRVMHNRSGGVTRLVVVRDEPGTITFEIDLPEGDAAPAATVVEVSGPDDALRATTSGYSVVFAGRS